MSGQQAVLDHFLERLSRFDGIELAVTYGSFGTPWATATSDVDIYFVPADDAARAAAEQVIVGDIGYDLWAVDWARLERIADLSDTLTPLLLASTVVLGGAAAREHFAALRDRCVANLADPDVRRSAARPLLDRAAALLGRTGGSDVLAAADAVGAILCARAFLAGTFLESGPGRVLDDGAPWLEASLREDLVTALTATNADARCIALSRGLGVVDRLAAEPPAALGDAAGWYEELHSTLVKIPRSVLSGRRCTAVMAAASAMVETREFCDRFGDTDRELPDLVDSLGDAESAQAAVSLTADLLERLLGVHGVEIRRFATVADLRASVGP